MAVLSPDDKKKKLWKVSCKFYERQCHQGIFASRGVLVTLASKGARRFLTADRFAAEGEKLLQLGAVGEDGDVTTDPKAGLNVELH